MSKILNKMCASSTEPYNLKLNAKQLWKNKFPIWKISITGCCKLEADFKFCHDEYTAIEAWLATTHNTYLNTDRPSTLKTEYSISLILRHKGLNFEPKGPLHLNYHKTVSCTLNCSPCWQAVIKQHPHRALAEHVHSLQALTIWYNDKYNTLIKK